MPQRHRSVVVSAFALAALASLLRASIRPPPPAPGLPAATAAQHCPFCDLRGADFSGRDLQKSNFSGANLENANLRNAKLEGAELIGADLTGARLDGADLRDADFTNADLTAASLENATIAGTKFVYANVTNSDFTGTKMGEARFGPSLAYAAGHPPDVDGAEISCELEGQFAELDPQRVRLPDCASATAKLYCGAFDPGGLANVVHVSATRGTDSSTCGASLNAPCKSIARGIANCGNARCAVLVAYDRYPLSATIAVRNGVDVYGGCATMPRPDPAYVSLVTAPPGGKPAFHAASLRDPTTIQGFAVLGTPGAVSTETSIAFSTSNTKELALSHLTLSAANGAAGANGGNGTAGSRGGDARTQGRDHRTSPDGGSNSQCPIANGGNGGTQRMWFSRRGTCMRAHTPPTGGGTGSTGISALAGAIGNDVCYGCPRTVRPTEGRPGQPGGTGRCGAAGVPSTNIEGSIANGAWMPGNGWMGGDGASGGGGGGGGAGGGCGYTGCLGEKSSYDGMPGGGGGAGGCGGRGGGGGKQGGASFALFVNGGTVIVTHSTIAGGAGGSGGAGGNGGPGGAGGNGGKSSLSSNPCATRGRSRGASGAGGGAGGSGGSGGGGAGGNGGPAIGIAETGGSNVTVDAATKFYTGTAGSGGRGGTPTGGDCAASPGNAGVSGPAADRRTY